MDPERFPNVAAYLEQLPDGMASYPDCCVKASVYRDALLSLSLSGDDLTGLPPEITELVERPPLVVAWVPEVHSCVMLIALLDRHFERGPAGLEACAHWTYERNKRLLTRPLYRALFLLLTPERLLRGVGRRWGAFRKGTSLELWAQGTGWAELVVRHPPHVFNETTLYGLSGAFRAAAEASGARNVKTEAKQLKEREARYIVTWER